MGLMDPTLATWAASAEGATPKREPTVARALAARSRVSTIVETRDRCVVSTIVETLVRPGLPAA